MDADLMRLPRKSAVVCVALLVSACAAGPGVGEPSSTPSPTPSASPSPSPAACLRPLLDLGATPVLSPCAYVLEQFPVGITFDIPEGDPPGWHVGKSNPGAAILLWYTPPEISWGLTFWSVDNVYVDPCDAAAGELDPPIEPSVDELVTALSELPGFQATAPVDVTVGAFPGKKVELTALDSGDDCPQPIVFRAGEDQADLSPGDTIALQILDVDGVRIVVFTIEPSEPDAAVQAELQQILDSIRIGPPS